MSKDLLFERKQYAYIENIVAIALKSISYKSQERSILINKITKGIFNKEKNWHNEFREFCEKNKDCVRSQSKYYAKDNYEGLYNEKYLKKFKPYLDIFICEVRKAKSDMIEDIKNQGVKSYFKCKKKKELK